MILAHFLHPDLFIAFSVPQKVVVEDLLDRSSFEAILRKAALNQVVESVWPLFRDTRRLIINDHLEDRFARLLTILERRLSSCQLIAEYAKGPHVYFFGVDLTSQHLRRLRKLGTNAGGAPKSLLAKLCRAAQVCDLDIALTVAQYIVGLKVTMQDLLFVQVLHTKSHFEDNVLHKLNRVLFPILMDDFLKRAIVHLFHQDNKLVIVIENFFRLHDMLVI